MKKLTWAFCSPPYILKASVVFRFVLLFPEILFPQFSRWWNFGCPWRHCLHILPLSWFSIQTFSAPPLYMVFRSLTFSCCITWEYFGQRGRRKVSGCMSGWHVEQNCNTNFFPSLSNIPKGCFFVLFLFSPLFNFSITKGKIRLPQMSMEEAGSLTDTKREGSDWGDFLFPKSKLNSGIKQLG